MIDTYDEFSNLVGACWVGGARHSSPLSPTEERKWALLFWPGVNLYVVGFSNRMAFVNFTQHAQFFLLPLLPFGVLRHIELGLFAPILIFGLALSGKIQAVIAQSPYEGALVAVIKSFVRIFGKHIVLIVESHGDFEKSFFMYRRVLLAPVVNFLMRRIATFAFSQTDAFRAISDDTSRQIESMGLRKPIVQFITWTDSKVFANIQRPVTVSSAKDIIYAGSLIPLKGVHILLSAFKELRDNQSGVKLHLVGASPNKAYLRQLYQQIDALEIRNNVEFHGSLLQDRLAELFAKSRVLVLPSLSEGLGRVLVEAMLCGTPVIGTQVGGIPELIRDGENGYLIPSGDAPALTEALQKIFQNPQIDAMGERAREIALDFFSPEKYKQGYQELFEIADRILSNTSQ